MANNARRSLTWQRVLLFLGGVAGTGFALIYFTPTDRSAKIPRRAKSTRIVRTSGFINRTIQDDDGTRRRFLVFVPPSMQASEIRPLLVSLNGYGENGNDGLAPLKNGLSLAIWENQRSFPFVVVWPQCEKGESWFENGPSAARAIQMIHQVATEFHTDPDRVYLTGVSDGGTGAWTLAAHYPELFAAIIPVSATPFFADVARVATANVPVWTYSVVDDERVIQASRDAHHSLIRRGSSPHLTELRVNGTSLKSGHDAWSFAYRDEGLYQWLSRQKRTAGRNAQPKYTVVEQRGVPLKIEAIAPHSTIELQGMRPVLTQIQASEFTEMHLEFRPSAGIKQFSVGLFESKAVRDEIGTTFDLAVGSLNCSGVYSWPTRKPICAAMPLAELSIRKGAWNDLRIRVTGASVAIELNGWQFLGETNISPPARNAVIGFVVNGDEGSQVELQNLRFLRAADTEVEPSRTKNDPVMLTNSESDSDNTSSVDLAAISVAWKRRESDFARVDVRWSELTGSIRDGLSSRSNGDGNAPEAATIERRLIVSENAIEYSTSWPYTELDFWTKAGVPTTPEIVFFNRAFQNRFRVPPENGSFQLTVHVDEAFRIDKIRDDVRRVNRVVIYSSPESWRDRVGEIDDISWRGPLLAFRPLSRAGIGCELDACELGSATGHVAGIRCIVLQETKRHGDNEFKRLYWIDPKRDFLVLRTIVRINGTVREQLDVEYRQNADQKWIPATWKMAVRPSMPAQTIGERFPGDDWLYLTSAAKTFECRSANNIGNAAKNIAPPIGAIIFDKSSGDWKRQIDSWRQETLTTQEVRSLTFAE
jgi:pimeloyl-ACP methyl ester carboxylesterase